MKVLANLFVIVLSIFVFLITTVASDEDTIDFESSKEVSIFTLTGSVTNDHPDLSWNGVAGANLYELHRLPVSFFGSGKDATFPFSSSGSFLDTAVHGAVLGGGIQQVRYTIEAYHEGEDENGSFKILIDSAGPVDYTADSID